MWCNVHYPSQHHVFNIHRQDFTVNSPDQFFPALYIVWRELQTARSTFWKLQFTLTALQLEETKKKVLQKRQREAKLPQNNPVRCILLYFKCTPCSLGSVLAKTAQGTVFLNTLPRANIRNTPMTERFSKGGDFTFQKIYEIPCSPTDRVKT